MGIRISPYIDLRSSVELPLLLRDIWFVSCLLRRQCIGQDLAVSFLKQPGDNFHLIYTADLEERTWRTIGCPGRISFMDSGEAMLWKIALYDEEKNEIVGPRILLITDLMSEHPISGSGLGTFASLVEELDLGFFTIEGLRKVCRGTWDSLEEPLLLTMQSTEHAPKPESSGISDSMLTSSTVSFFRPRPSKLKYSPIAHRVIDRAVGRPLWEYTKDKELARALISVLQSMYALSCVRGLTHISTLSSA